MASRPGQASNSGTLSLSLVSHGGCWGGKEHTAFCDFRKRSIQSLSGGKISFADFLEIMHTHSEKESIPEEIVKAFRASDKSGSGQISGRELRRILMNWGEKLSPREADGIFREANISPNGAVRYEDFVRVLCAPVPDYY